MPITVSTTMPSTRPSHCHKQKNEKGPEKRGRDHAQKHAEEGGYQKIAALDKGGQRHRAATQCLQAEILACRGHDCEDGGHNNGIKVWQRGGEAQKDRKGAKIEDPIEFEDISIFLQLLLAEQIGDHRFGGFQKNTEKEKKKIHISTYVQL